MDKAVERWRSDRMQQDITLARWGHFGVPVLAFPTAGGDAVIEHLHHVRALDLRRGAGLAHEARDRRGVLGERRGHELDRDLGAQGQVIGVSGCTGHCFGPHVHFEVRVNGVPVDPLGYL